MTQLTVTDSVRYDRAGATRNGTMSIHYTFLSNGHVLAYRRYMNRNDRRIASHYYSSYAEAYDHISKITEDNLFVISSSRKHREPWWCNDNMRRRFCHFITHHDAKTMDNLRAYLRH